jgi:hypothetical protein
VQVLVSVVERDLAAVGRTSAAGADVFAPLRRALCEAGLADLSVRPATAADVDSLGSSWAKRLGVPARRPAWLLSAGRNSPA